MTRAYNPIDPERLAALVADVLAGAPVPGSALRVALDGPTCASPGVFAAALVDPLRVRARPTALISATCFWRDASLRLEYGRDDPLCYPGWLDAAGLRREVLQPLGPGGCGAYLPSLRDPTTNRATREPPRPAPPGGVVVVYGELLLGRGLPFDLTVHLAVSPAARRRRTDPQLAWTLPALDRYDTAVAPVGNADVVVRLDDPRHPAIAVSE